MLNICNNVAIWEGNCLFIQIGLGLVLCVTRDENLITFNNTLSGHQLESQEAKYLGITIRYALKWKIHVNNSCTKDLSFKTRTWCVLNEIYLYQHSTFL